jgi:hypothetical protein
MNKELIPQTSIMQKEFIPYEQAFDLESIGFDIRPDFGNQTSLYNKEGIRIMYINYGVMGSGLDEGYIYAPTFSQAFRWLLDKHYLYGIIIPTITMYWTFKTTTVIQDMVEVPPYNHVHAYDYSSREEAELACLKKLIEIVKNK